MQPGSWLGHYEILEQLGAGGMGVVYKAVDSQLRRDIAVKIILPESALNPVSHRRLLNEAKAASALNHPNIVTVYEAASIDGVDFIAMELIVGETLSARIARSRIPIREAFQLASQIAEGLAAGHRRGMVHRDLKPSNGSGNRAGALSLCQPNIENAEGARTQSFGEPGLFCLHFSGTQGKCVDETDSGRYAEMIRERK